MDCGNGRGVKRSGPISRAGAGRKNAGTDDRFDGLFAVVGSSNLDSRSAAINEELDITVYDPDFGREMEAVFDRDLKNSRVYGLDEFRRRSIWERGSEALMAPFHSQL